MVCAFVTNEYMQEGTKELPTNAKTSLKDVKLYLTTTKQEIDNLLKTNPEELEVTLNNILQASGKIVTEQLAEYSHAVSLTNLNDIVAGLESIREDLRLMNKITQELRINASQLDIGAYPCSHIFTFIEPNWKIGKFDTFGISSFYNLYQSDLNCEKLSCFHVHFRQIYLKYNHIYISFKIYSYNESYFMEREL